MGDENQTFVGWDNILKANKTHPLTVYMEGTRVPRPGNVTIWSEPHPEYSNRTVPVVHMPTNMLYNTTSVTKKRSIWCEFTEVANEDEFCAENDITDPAYPDAVYIGLDIYGSYAKVLEWDEDEGDYESKRAPLSSPAAQPDHSQKRYDYASSNGFYGLSEALADEWTNYGAYGAVPWYGCTCMSAGGSWIATGSMQFTWNDGPYNGYGDCWNANCDGA
ncbi:hypothetical protein BX600DRAFT_471586 [Xylariales sp. PMI_506]|nr:hypothetical protein BX600DRAFT_471586 [Xylariales sp. PMI_506]